MTIEEVEKQIKDLVEKNGFEIGYNLDFPIYKILPDEVKLALNILGKHGMTLKMVLGPKKV